MYVATCLNVNKRSPNIKNLTQYGAAGYLSTMGGDYVYIICDRICEN